MPLPRSVANAARDALCRAVAAGFVLLVLGAHPVVVGAFQDEDGERANASVQIVHGISDAGPLDVYVDGALALIGIVFLEASADLRLANGEHQMAVVPTGSAPDAAIASGAIAVTGGSRIYATLLGTVDAAAVGLFTVDEGRLDAGRARFRVIHGVADAGEIVPAFTGGDAISTPLSFGDASEYAAIDAGTYDLDALDAASGAPLLSLPQTVFAEGTTNDLILVGQVVDGTLQVMIETTEAGVVQIAGRAVQVINGTCADPGDAVAELGIARPGQGDPIGVGDVLPVENGFGLAIVPFATLIETPHAVTVSRGEQGDRVFACADIGGRLTDTGALIVALRGDRSGAPAGVAVLAPGLEDPNATGVSIFLVTDSALPAEPAATEGTPVAADGAVTG